VLRAQSGERREGNLQHADKNAHAARPSSGRLRYLNVAFGRTLREHLAMRPKQEASMIIIDGQIHLWEKGEPF